ncbi:MAG: TRAP transporter substrate-binding protein [Rhodobacteraceae bacterium]|nr:TRAP transporter substrate-binding protein [Paracoccaceae bacterium]
MAIRSWFWLFALALLGGGAWGPTAAAQEITLRVHHFLSDKAPAHSKLLAPWAERVQSQSGGRIQVKIFPRMGLGGKPPELYRQAKDGLVDVVWTLAGYTPGQFPRVEVFELPSVHRGSARATNLAIQETFDVLADDFADVHPLLVHVHAGNAIHLRDRRMSRPEDIIGLRVRTPSRTGAWLLNDVGATALGMPVPALPKALDAGTVDGALVPFEIVPPLKLQDRTQYSVEGANGERFGTSVFLLLMNKQRYQNLPDDLKRVIDANSGAALAESMGEVWDGVENVGKRLQLESGGEILQLSPDQLRPFNETAEKITKRWVIETQGLGIDASGLVQAASAAVDRNSR